MSTAGASTLQTMDGTTNIYAGTHNTGRPSQETLVPNGATAGGDPLGGRRMDTESPAPMTEQETSNNGLEAGRRSPMADREIAHSIYERSADRQDEVRDALGKMLDMVDKLTLLLHTSLREKMEVETTLRVTQSNLALALSNTEMLEAALKRDASGRRPDVGWSRSASSPATAPLPASPSVPAKNETGFFNKFLRNSTGINSPTGTYAHHAHNSSGSSILHTPHSSVDSMMMKGHLQGLTSPSMPSLHSNAPTNTSRKEEELTQALQRERENTAKALEEKQKLEEELESLSQALFEEANKMVATERQQKAQIEEELHNVREEREALKGALKIVEGENATLRTGATLPSSTPDVSVVRERTRALTINTDKAGTETGTQVGIDLTQTPSTSDIRETKTTAESKTSPVEAVPVEPNPWTAPTPPNNNADAKSGGFDYSNTLLRGGISFGM